MPLHEVVLHDNRNREALLDKLVAKVRAECGDLASDVAKDIGNRVFALEFDGDARVLGAGLKSLIADFCDAEDKAIGANGSTPLVEHRVRSLAPAPAPAARNDDMVPHMDLPVESVAQMAAVEPPPLPDLALPPPAFEDDVESEKAPEASEPPKPSVIERVVAAVAPKKKDQKSSAPSPRVRGR